MTLESGLKVGLGSTGMAGIVISSIEHVINVMMFNHRIGAGFGFAVTSVSFLLTILKTTGVPFSLAFTWPLFG
jgi:hypothetical protein